MVRTFLLALISFIVSAPVCAADGNRLAYLDESANPYYVGRDFPRLITPQWVGEAGVEAVVVLAIDDMTDNPAKYEAYLRPILNRRGWATRSAHGKAIRCWRIRRDLMTRAG